MWKIVVSAKASVLYIYIDYRETLNPIGPHAVPICQATALTKPVPFPCNFLVLPKITV